jgi:hypothetical protein
MVVVHAFAGGKQKDELTSKKNNFDDSISLSLYNKREEALFLEVTIIYINSRVMSIITTINQDISPAWKKIAIYFLLSLYSHTLDTFTLFD